MSAADLEKLRDGCHATELYDAAMALRSLLVEARDALRRVEMTSGVDHPDGTFCPECDSETVYGPASDSLEHRRGCLLAALLARIEAEVGHG